MTFLQNKNDPEPAEGPARRWVAFGGGISAEQLAWLRAELQAAKEAGQRVVLLGHLPVMPGTSPGEPGYVKILWLTPAGPFSAL